VSEHAARENLPKRDRGTHLLRAAYRAIGVAKIPDRRWSSDEPTVRALLNGLRRWQP
jgi:hypothetical protein